MADPNLCFFVALPLLRARKINNRAAEGRVQKKREENARSTRYRDNNSNGIFWTRSIPRFLTPPEDLRPGTEFWTRSSGHSGRTIKNEKRGAFYFSADTAVYVCLRTCVRTRVRACVCVYVVRSRSFAKAPRKFRLRTTCCASKVESLLGGRVSMVRA